MAKQPVPDRRDQPHSDFPAQRALAAAGYTRLAHITRAHEADLLKRHAMSPKALAQLRRALACTITSTEVNIACGALVDALLD